MPKVLQYQGGLGCYIHDDCFTCNLPDCEFDEYWRYRVKEKEQDDLVNLLESVWRGIDWDYYPQSLLRKIYDFYINRIKSAAYAPTLELFLERLCHDMHCSLPVNMPLWFYLEPKDHRHYLRLLRNETRILVYIFRARNDKSKKEKKSESKNRGQNQVANANGALGGTDRLFE